MAVLATLAKNPEQALLENPGLLPTVLRLLKPVYPEHAYTNKIRAKLIELAT